MSEWQPIETAPKDGTRILLGWRAKDGYSGEVAEGYWMVYPERNYWGEIGWYIVDDDVLTERPSHPTDWQHLPAPPK